MPLVAFFSTAWLSLPLSRDVPGQLGVVIAQKILILRAGRVVALLVLVFRFVLGYQHEPEAVLRLRSDLQRIHASPAPLHWQCQEFRASGTGTTCGPPRVFISTFWAGVSRRKRCSDISDHWEHRRSGQSSIYGSLHQAWGAAPAYL